MTWQSNPYAAPLLLAVLPLLGIAVVAWRYRTRRAAGIFFVFTLAVIGYMLSYSLELLSVTLPAMMVWLRFEYVFSTTLPVLFLLFVLAFTGYDSWLVMRRIVSLFFIPAIHIAAVWTNDYLHLNWQTTGTETVQNVVLFTRTYGPVFWLGTGYLYIVAALSTIILLVSMARYPNLYKNQIMPVLLPITAVFVASLLTITGASFNLKVDLTPYGYGFVSFFFGWSMFRYQLFEIMPAAEGAIIKGISDAVLVLDAESRVIDLNPAAEELVGAGGAKAIGQPADKLFAQISTPISSADETRRTHSEVTMIVGGNEQHFDLRISPLRSHSGEVVGRIVVLRNITRLKQAEASVRKYAAELEERNRDLDAFSRTVAHDLQNPVSLVVGYIDMLQDSIGKELPAQEQGWLMAAERAGIKMADMIGELLRLASVPDTGNILVTVDMNAVVQSAIERLHMEINRRGIQIEVAPEIPSALGNPVLLEEVFANLISNAIKYMGSDNPSPHIKVRGYRQENGSQDTGDYARYEVWDNGLGISPEAHARLFDAFTRFHADKANGLGLGLSIVARILRRLNGTVGVDSEPGKGSTFWFILPTSVAK